MENTERNEDLIRRFVEAGNARDYDALETIVSPTFQRHCPATPEVEVRSFGDFRRFLERDAETFPDARVTLELLVAEGDLVGFWAIFEGTQSGALGPFPPSGRRAVCPFGGVFRIDQARIAELWLTWDNMAMLAQLGHLPVPTPPA